jgi:NAD-dependent deacetylase
MPSPFDQSPHEDGDHGPYDDEQESNDGHAAALYHLPETPPMSSPAAPLERLRHYLTRTRNGVVFTGAGISTESGIPDFRSPGGLWTRYRPIEYGDFISSEEARRETWRRKFAMTRVVDHAPPNRGHHAVARLVAEGVVGVVITQNIDGLHQAAGVADDRVIELHGNGTYATCLDCNERYELEEIRVRFETDEAPPLCKVCNGFVKPATISFGQPMPLEAMRRAEEAACACDLFLVAGSSLVVYPAAAIPALAKRHGAHLVILNREETELDPIADLVVHAEIGPTLASLLAEPMVDRTS